MKKIMILAVMAVMGLQMQAQIVSSRSSMVTRQVYDEPKSYHGWSTFGIEYLPSSWHDSGDSKSFTGLALNYTNAISLTQSAPLFIEWGIGGQYSFYSKNDFKINYASVKAPVNFMYDFQIPGSRINIAPYAGVKLRFNVWGQAKEEYRGESESWNLFDSDEGGWKRFQIGWNIGAKARFNDKFFVGMAYGTDFSEIADGMKVHEISLSLGLVF